MLITKIHRLYGLCVPILFQAITLFQLLAFMVYRLHFPFQVTSNWIVRSYGCCCTRKFRAFWVEQRIGYESEPLTGDFKKNLPSCCQVIRCFEFDGFSYLPSCCLVIRCFGFDGFSSLPIRL